MESEPVDLDAAEARVLGCLIEKALTTPDQYPMSLNGVRLACNQVSNRNPVVAYDETAVATTLRRLADRGLAKLVHRVGDRVVKYIHAADNVLELDRGELALLAVLLLRGDQTSGELRQRTDRYAAFDSLLAVERTLGRLTMRTPALVSELGRHPGQKESRFRQLLTVEAGTAEGASPRFVPAGVPASVPGAVDPADSVAELRHEITTLRSRFERLLEALGVDEI